MKILTILIVLFAINSAQAQTIADKNFVKENSPIFLVDGFSNFSATATNQNSNFGQKKFLVAGNDSQFFFKTGVKTSSLAKYGAIAKIEFNFNSKNSRKKNENPNLDQAFLFAQNSLGKFELGNLQSPNQKMKTGAAKLARGAGGINGKYLENVNLPNVTNASSNLKLPAFILLAQSPIGHGGFARSNYLNFNRSNFRALKDDSFDGVEDATKINYYTPQIEGLQLGVSFAPNSANSGITATNYYNSSAIKISNITSFAANYSQDFDNLGVEISASFEQGQVKNSSNSDAVSRHNLSAYDFGAALSYFGFNVGASYGSWGKSLQAKNGIYSCNYDSSKNLTEQNCSENSQKFGEANYYTGGISYNFGPISASATAIKSQFQKNKYQAISLGVDYKLSRDLMPYFELTKFAFKSNQPKALGLQQQSIKNNQSYVFLTGILISF